VRVHTHDVTLLLMPFDLQPTLTGSLLHLRPLKPEDFHPLYAVASDPLIWEQHPHFDRYKKDVFEKFFQIALDSRGAFTVIDNKTNQVIGSSRFTELNEEKSEIEIGFTFLARSHWGGLYNREMKSLMLAHAFQFVRTVIFLVGPKNLRSQRALAKIGALPAGSITHPTRGENLVFRITSEPHNAQRQ
jgi:RimJ/RimL family protein N-acetyltransferase